MPKIPYLRLSSFYFFYFATLGAFIPYWGLYLKDAGFNAQQIGELSALSSATRMITPSFGGWLADRSGKRMRVIRVSCFLTALIFTGFLVAQGYLQLLIITLVFGLFSNIALPQFEAVTLYHLKQQDHRYSQIRLWGSVGFIMAVLAMGSLLDFQSVKSLPVIVLVILVANWLVTLVVPETHAEKHTGQALGLGAVIGKAEVLAFLVVCLLLQMAHAPYYVFYSLYLKQYHYSATLTGSLWALGVAAEIVLFVFMARLLKRFSLRTVLLSSIALGIIRWLLMAFCAHQTVTLACAQLLHAATFGGVHVATIHLVQGYFGDRHHGKGQALMVSFSYGVGGLLGSYGSGQFWQALGGEMVFMLCACCGTLALLIAWVWVGKGKKTNIQVPAVK